jgi:hypothetical protein
LENTILGVYIQQEFDWENRIFLTGAIRRDDNSAFGAKFNNAFYPKVMAAWVVHEEDFWNVDWVSQLRLRGAWGTSGQQPRRVRGVVPLHGQQPAADSGSPFVQEP